MGTQAPSNVVLDRPAIHTGLSRVTPSCTVTQVIYSPPCQSSIPPNTYHFTAGELRCGELTPTKIIVILMEQSQLWSNLPLNFQEYETKPGTEVIP